jgi:two-component system LytT family sensor kinase
VRALPALGRLAPADSEGRTAVRAERVAFAMVHAVSLALPPLRAGLTVDAARRAAPHMRKLLGTPAVALTAGSELLVWEGLGLEGHGHTVAGHAAQILHSRRTRVLAVECDRPGCPIRRTVATPVMVDRTPVGVLCAYAAATSAGLVRATTEIAGWISGQLELAEMDRSRARSVRAELHAMRPQISPHFVFNSLTAIMSFMRTDPDRAKDLLQDFSDVTRYSLKRHAAVAALEEEIRSIEPYLALERVRFSDRLNVRLQVAPEVLSVAVPFLCLPLLVDNAIRHGMERKAGPGHLAIVAGPIGNDVLVSVRDDGVGMDPERVGRVLRGEEESDSGLGNVHRRLRLAFGETYGLVVETHPGQGSTVSMRVPRTPPEP